MNGVRAVHLVSAAIVVACAAVWLATGREAFSRWPDARLDAADAPIARAEEDLLDEIGIDLGPAAVGAGRLESRFALGLLPGGADPKHLASVATGIGVSLMASGIAEIGARLGRRMRGARG
ncbi:MAG: hypothetical protein KF817_13155 [Phycisphaeraceae bacterium]|nr:hypothetical protein [Phycisphaeraceae bacterium]